MATKYVRCDSHCKYPAYSADEVDALVNDTKGALNESIATKINKSDIVLIEKTITVPTTGVGELEIDFPEGFNKNNCVVLTADYKRHEDGTEYWPRQYNLLANGNLNPSVCLGNPQTYDATKILITLTLGSLSAEIVEDVRIVLMKVGV